MLRKRCSTRRSCERQGQNARGLFKIQPNIYDGAVLQKWLTAKGLVSLDSKYATEPVQIIVSVKLKVYDKHIAHCF